MSNTYHAAPSGQDATGKTLCGRSLYADSIMLHTVSLRRFDEERGGTTATPLNGGLCRQCLKAWDKDR